jgi:hypothetical protein
MAGRNISATHVALGTTRIMRTCATLGQVAGTASSLCLKHSVSPRHLTERHIDELQQTLLKDDCFILETPTRDPRDLARHATASATSEAPLVLEPTGEFASLDWDRSQIFPVSQNNIREIRLYTKSSSKKTEEISVEFLPATDIWSFNEKLAEKPLVSGAELPAHFEGWTAFGINAKVHANRLYRVNVHGSDGLEWGVRRPVHGVSAAKRSPSWERWISEKPMYAMRLDPPSFPFSPKNVVNGVARPEKWTNIWISDPSKALPQSFTLDFRKETTFNSVYITFDTCLHFDMGDSSFRNFPPLSRIKECASDYVLQAFNGGRWRTICETKGNYHRRRIHRFEQVTTTKLRLEILKTNGDPSARLYEMRVYDE